MKRWRAAWRGVPGRQKAMLALLLALLAVLQIDQPFPDTAPLHHGPTLLAILVAPLLLARWPLTTGELAAVILFLALHSIGGRWTYSNVPYDLWTQAMFGVTLSDAMGWDRNHYDRLVHLMFGVLAVPPIVGLSRRIGGLSFPLAATVAIGVVLAVGALYELFEWGLSLAAAPDVADGYNGQQGDMWDAQKDMALALLGAIMAVGWPVVRQGRR